MTVESWLDAQVRQLREALAKLAASVMWRNGGPLAVQAARWTTADEIEEVVESSMSRWNEEVGWRKVLLEIGGAGDADVADLTEVLPEE